MCPKQAWLFVVSALLCTAKAASATPDPAKSAPAHSPLAKVQSGKAQPEVEVGTGTKVKVPKRNTPATAKMSLPIPDSSLWVRYYQAGEDASLTHHDADLAKKYWMASIAELEKHPPAKGEDIFLAVKLSALEYGLMSSYPADWSKQTGDVDEIMKERKEQVETLQRIARINEYFAPKDDLLRIKADERYEIAKKAYDKALAAAAAAKKSQPKSLNGDENPTSD